ncbi:DUF6029 family protein [Flavilitoribacter nigricans]|uniref:Uncharacterized protein n=1 Tax=Flavilitoribacter nigricans (strain ATCC 23147 / DSM 23189 / NBRC 102662 / NCIMB 1420 / SS-2) TaxID=1122177 RepID=A0A2D0NK17_FLAN2|nr:DUF6029 family protein [Flavilitoribacter nigricans]PHN08083.1 hypothetical protein CRP01_03445 [Flavilitoribacter nigricans DSM 23189 = NBRC 102662]
MYKITLNSVVRKILYGLIFWVCAISVSAQKGGGGQLTGSFQANANFFIRDSLIGAANTPQYDRQKYGAEAWLNLNYQNWGFDFGLRYDLFNNSNLLNPTDSYTAQGIGAWYIRKQIDKLGLQVGYIYDQIGSGIIFRAFEERPLLIDNALVGGRLTYDLSENWQVKAFTGQQKQQFDRYDSILKGLNIEGFLLLGDSTSRWSIAPGLGIVNRTLDDASMNSLVATLNTYTERDTFTPKYNTYAFSLYNTLSAGPITWYAEAAYKTKDNLNDPFGRFERDSTVVIGDKYFLAPGSVLYSSLSYAASGLGISIEAKRTENFSFRIRPQAQLNRGLVGFLPPMTRVNTYRLTSRYNAATQELGEWAWQLDARYTTPDRNWSFYLNRSHIDDLQGGKLYREWYSEVIYKHKKLWTLTAGLQFQTYNQERYEVKPGVPLLQTKTPYLDFLYKFTRRKSIRLELQAMLVGDDAAVNSRQDYGNWLFGLVELSLAPRWVFAVSDMYNLAPGRNSPELDGKKKGLHYPRLDVYYTLRANRFSLSYIKQVEGVVCTGGICRLEPAFSGLRFSVTTNF